MNVMSKRRQVVGTIALVLGLAATAASAPSGPPIRIGGTLALTGPLAATALLHKIAGEIYVDEMNRGQGLLGRPVEWVLLDDQSKAEVTRSLYERLITVDKVDLLIGPYATNSILAATAVAQRYQKILVHHTFGLPHLAKYEMHFPTAAWGPEPNHTMPALVFDALAVCWGAGRGGPAWAKGRPPSGVRVRHARFRTHRRAHQGREPGLAVGRRSGGSMAIRCSRR